MVRNMSWSRGKSRQGQTVVHWLAVKLLGGMLVSGTLLYGQVTYYTTPSVVMVKTFGSDVWGREGATTVNYFCSGLTCDSVLGVSTIPSNMGDITPNYLLFNELWGWENVFIIDRGTQTGMGVQATGGACNMGTNLGVNTAWEVNTSEVYFGGVGCRSGQPASMAGLVARVNPVNNSLDWAKLVIDTSSPFSLVLDITVHPWIQQVVGILSGAGRHIFAIDAQGSQLLWAHRSTNIAWRAIYTTPVDSTSVVVAGTHDVSADTLYVCLLSALMGGIPTACQKIYSPEISTISPEAIFSKGAIAYIAGRMADTNNMTYGYVLRVNLYTGLEWVTIVDSIQTFGQGAIREAGNGRIVVGGLTRGNHPAFVHLFETNGKGLTTECMRQPQWNSTPFTWQPETPNVILSDYSQNVGVLANQQATFSQVNAIRDTLCMPCGGFISVSVSANPTTVGVGDPVTVTVNSGYNCHVCMIDWGDGTTTPCNVTTHTYNQTGSYWVVATCQDTLCLLSDADSVLITVSDSGVGTGLQMPEALGVRVIYSGELITVYAGQGNLATVRLQAIDGRTLEVVRAGGRASARIRLPEAKGVYLLVIELADGRRGLYRVIR